MRIFGVILAILVGAGGGWYFFHQDLKEPPLVQSGSTVLAPGRSVPKGMKEYRDPEFYMSVLYPETLIVNKRAEGSGAVTITFQNPQTSQGFQLFVTPFNETQISEERFHQDVPSGVRTSPENILLDGVPATAFYSKDEFLGETREVWFIYKGFLYELTVPKSLESWFRDILQTWEFVK